MFAAYSIEYTELQNNLKYDEQWNRIIIYHMLITYCSAHVYGNHHKTLTSTTNIAAVVGEYLEIETKVHPYTKLAVNFSPKLFNQNKRICSHERRSVANVTSRVRREKDVINSPIQVRTAMTVKATLTICQTPFVSCL